MKRIVILLLILNILSMPVLALDLDTSVDDEIRKNYNPNLLEDDVGLPPLPKILNEPTTYTPKKIPLKHIQAQVQPQSQR